MNHEEALDRCIELALGAVASGGGGPFGAVVVRDGAVIAEAHNEVVPARDPTAHAEVLAIRRACAALGDFSLSGAALYASAEPCPMCLGAIFWARLDAVYYAATRADAARGGFDDAAFYDELARAPAQRRTPSRHVARPAAVEPFRRWVASPLAVRY